MAAVAGRGAVALIGVGLAGGLITGLVAGCSSNGTHPPKSDVTITACRQDPDSRKALVSGTIHNHSSKRSTYVVVVDVSANDSKIESGFASVLRLDAGERTSFTLHPHGADVPTGTKLTCSLNSVTRVGA